MRVPYLINQRSDRHGLLLHACREAGVDLVTDAQVVDYRATVSAAAAVYAGGREEWADVVIAADGLHSVARRLLVDDELLLRPR
jgi:2-polyprenyl-6-methoxyphenol hydroxylase-like FAD-dependent oxidoreductase